MADLPSYFFKFIPPGFKFNLSIPKSFLPNLDGWRCEKAILRRECHKWPVHITDEGVFGDGWRKFVTDNGVQDMDFIVFKHQGNMVFDFLVFDQSTCERQYPPDLFEHAENPLTESDLLHTQKTPKMLNKRKRTNYSSQSKDEFRLDNNPCFMITMTPYYMRTTRLNVPIDFARSNGLLTKRMHTQVVLVDEEQQTWSATLTNNTSKIILTDLRELITNSGVKVGDTCMFELAKAGEVPVFHFHRKKPTNTHVQVKKEPSSTTHKATNSTCSFISTLKPYNLKKSCLHLPVEFTNSNDLRTGEVILRDDEGRSWKSLLRKSATNRFSLCNGIRDLRVANELTEGDAYNFELVENQKDKPPILNFSLIGKTPVKNHNKIIKRTGSIIKKSTGLSLNNHAYKFVLDEKEKEKEKEKEEKGKPHIMKDFRPRTTATRNCIEVQKETSSTRYFISTLKPYSFKRSCLFLPVEFSISNELSKGEVIFIDDKHRSWKFQLNKCGTNRFYVAGCGLRDFWVANGLTKGVEYKFELVENKNGKPPIVNFSYLRKKPTKNHIQVKKEASSTIKKATSSAPHFISTLKSYNIKKSYLHLPMKFSTSNNLRKGDVILRDDKGGSWKLRLNKSSRDQFFLGCGFRDFRVANGLTEGDSCKFELVENEKDKPPIVHFSCLGKKHVTNHI